jgi:hypothetical protein
MNGGLHFTCARLILGKTMDGQKKKKVQAPDAALLWY